MAEDRVRTPEAATLFGEDPPTAWTPLDAPPQLAEVAAYSVVPTAIGADHFEFGGRNGAGRWMSLPDGRPRTCSMPSLDTT